jgi:ribonuclease PH
MTLPKKRKDGRGALVLRPVKITRNYTMHPEGSVLIEIGSTIVLCAATVEEKLPPWMKDSGRGWVTAEYGLLPRSTNVRSPRERGSVSGRTHEIQRLIGRAFRSVVDLNQLGSRTITIDCDVLQADGGTRAAAITGGMVALCDAVGFLKERKIISGNPVRELLGAVSVGILDEGPLLDLTYEEDRRARVDMNLVMTESGAFVEVQGTAEGKPFSRSQLNRLLDAGESGIRDLIASQKRALGIK